MLRYLLAFNKVAKERDNAPLNCTVILIFRKPKNFSRFYFWTHFVLPKLLCDYEITIINYARDKNSQTKQRHLEIQPYSVIFILCLKFFIVHFFYNKLQVHV